MDPFEALAEPVGRELLGRLAAGPLPVHQRFHLVETPVGAREVK